MAVFGVLAVNAEDRGRRVRLSAPEALLLAAGSLLVLYAFMADALAILPADARALSRLRPGPFDWPIFLVGWAAALAAAIRAFLRRPRGPSAGARSP